MYDSRTVYIPPGYGKIRFGREEMWNITVAVLALTLAFTIFVILNWNPGNINGMTRIFWYLFAGGVAFVAVITGFLLHELAHKIIAQRNGAWAEFRAYPLGLLIAIIFAFLGFVFAAPGAVYIQGMISKKQNGLISIAGPLVNISLGAVFLISAIYIETGLLGFALELIALINLTLGAFNMIPIPPFDGYKVLRWNIPVYALTALAALGLLLTAFWTLHAAFF